MATAEDISYVRLATNLEDDDPFYTSIYLGGLVDENGRDGASAVVWRQKAAKYAELVDVTEAGASHKFSELHKNALAMAAHYDAIEESFVIERPRVKQIER